VETTRILAFLSTHPFSVLFIAFIVLNVALKYWLDSRQIRSILAHRSAVPKAFAKDITLAAHQKAADYSVAKIRFSQKTRWVGLAVLVIATFGGLIELIYNEVTALMGTGLIAQVFIVGIFGLISGLVDLPFDWLEQFGLEEKFGFNRMTAAQFFKDQALSTALSFVIGFPLLSAIFAIWNFAGSYWWIWAWLVYVVFSLALLWIYPTFIAPLFNKFENLPEGELRDRVTKLLERVGFESQGLYVMDASKRSGKGNAYMTGFGRNKRIVFFDTLLKRLTPEETEAVLAHELGHYKLKHIFKMMAVSFSLSFIVFAVLSWAADASWFYTSLGVELNRGPSHGVALLLFFLIFPLFTFPFTPLSSLSSRKHEFEADEFAVKNANGAALASALVKLYGDNASTLTPDPVYAAVYSSHPEASVRIETIEKKMAAAK
jgi:STE24 endopeptidase